MKDHNFEEPYKSIWGEEENINLLCTNCKAVIKVGKGVVNWVSHPYQELNLFRPLSEENLLSCKEYQLKNLLK